jgi:hypothetical protein
MSTTRFSFVPDKIVRTHLERAFELVKELLLLSEAKNYSPELKSSLRKTMIIYTASIIEVLLLLILKSCKTEKDCGVEKDSIGKTLYEVNNRKYRSYQEESGKN